MADPSQQPSAEGAEQTQGEPRGEGSEPTTGAAPEGGGKTDDSELEQLRAKNNQLSTENASLRSQIIGLENHKRKSEGTTKTLEQRVAELEDSNRQASERVLKLERDDRIRDGIEAAIKDVPEGRHKAARAIAQGLAADIDLGAQDNAAAIDKLRKTLKDDYSDVLAAGTTRGTLPHIPAPANSSTLPPNNEGRPVDSRGGRLL